MGNPRRVAAWSGIGLLGVLVVLGMSVLFLLATEPGARIAFNLVLPRLPASIGLSVEEVEGRLVGPLRLDGVQLVSGGVRLEARRLDLTWNPRAMFMRRLSIDRLDVAGLSIVVDTARSATDDGQPSPRDSSTVTLPFPIDFGIVVIDDGSVLVPGVALVDGMHVELTGSTSNYQSDGRANVAGPSLPAADVRFTGNGSLDGMVVDRVQVETLDGIMTVTGAITWLPVLYWDVTLDVDSVAYGELLGSTQEWPGRMSITASTSGNPEDYQVEATVNGTGPRLPPSTVQLAGRGSTAGFVFDEARAEVLGGRARVAGSLGWRPDVKWDVSLVLDSLAPGPLLPDSAEWPGAVTFHGRSRGQLVDGEPQASVTVDTLYGRLRDLPLAGHVEGEILGRDIEVEESWLEWGDARLDVAGRWADSIAGRFSVDVPDLAALHPRWAGLVQSKGTVSGSPSALRIDAALVADGVGMDSLSVAEARGVVAVVVDSTPSGTVDLVVRAFTSGAVVIDSASLHAAGTSPDHTVGVRAHGPRGYLTVDLAGRWLDREWQGTLDRLDVAQADLGNWSLNAPVSLAISDSSVRVDSLCLAADDASVCGGGTWHRTEPWSAEASLIAVPVALFDPLVPDSLTVSGTIDATVHASAGADGMLDADLAVTVGPGEISYPAGGERRAFHYRPVVLRSTIDSAGLAGETSITFTLPSGEDFATIDVEGALPEYRRITDSLPGQTIMGHVVANVGDVSLIRALDPSITRATGRVTADMTFSGTVSDPIAEGQARYEGGEIEVPDLGITLEDVELVAVGEREGGLRVEGQARSGSGTVVIAGASPLVPSPEKPATLTLKGQGFQAVSTPEADVVVSPDLRLSMTRDSADLTGTVTLHKAVIELTEVPANAVPVSKDVVFVDVDSTVRRGPVTVTSSVRVVLGDNVTFSGFGFRADLEGGFRAEDRPNQPTTGSGTITISRGRYRAHGQDLRIDDGRVVFNGPIDDPALDIRAYREARDRTIAGLDITGTLKRPEATVFSNPSMSQSEAMSYLMFGRPLERGNSSEQNRMADAAAAVGGDMLAQSLGAKVGLEAGIEQGTNPNDAALVAGTYLSPQLFVAYGVGLFDRINIFRVRYEFTRRWSIQGESSRESSADVFFTFERK